MTDSDRLLEALEKYRADNEMTYADLQRKLGITKMAWWHWTKGGRGIPPKRIPFIVYDLKLNSSEIIRKTMSKNVYYTGSVDYAKRYSAAVILGNTEDSKRYLRDAGMYVYDLLNSYDFPVDYILTNRSNGESTQLLVHIGLVKYLIEISPSKILSYRFTRIIGGSSDILHDGAFSTTILKVITSFLNKENKKKNKNAQKNKEDATHLMSGARNLTSIEL